jgi:hypothetical protein
MHGHVKASHSNKARAAEYEICVNFELSSIGPWRAPSADFRESRSSFDGLSVIADAELMATAIKTIRRVWYGKIPYFTLSIRMNKHHAIVEEEASRSACSRNTSNDIFVEIESERFRLPSMNTRVDFVLTLLNNRDDLQQLCVEETSMAVSRRLESHFHKYAQAILMTQVPLERKLATS